jgi:hypothetical protein
MWFYSQRAGAENLIKEANNDAGLNFVSTSITAGWGPGQLEAKLESRRLTRDSRRRRYGVRFQARISVDRVVRNLEVTFAKLKRP